MGTHPDWSLASEITSTLGMPTTAGYECPLIPECWHRWSDRTCCRLTTDQMSKSSMVCPQDREDEVAWQGRVPSRECRACSRLGMDGVGCKIVGLHPHTRGLIFIGSQDL